MAAWHRRQVWEPTYVRSADETCGAATRCGDGACDDTLTESVAKTVATATTITVNEERMLIVRIPVQRAAPRVALYFNRRCPGLS